MFCCIASTCYTVLVMTCGVSTSPCACTVVACIQQPNHVHALLLCVDNSPKSEHSCIQSASAQPAKAHNERSAASSSDSGQGDMVV